MKKTTQKITYPSVNLKDSYEDFEFKDEIDYPTYRMIMATFHLTLLDSMMNEGAVYMLPQGLGHIGCFQRSTYGRGVFDYKLYNTEGIKRYIKNNHSGGRVVKFH